MNETDKPPKDLTGKRFGLLTVKAFDHRTSHGTSYWLCQCSCGEIHSVGSSYMRHGRVASCPCQNPRPAKIVMKAIPGFLGYFAGSDGEIYSLRPRSSKCVPPLWPRKLAAYTNKIGYRYVAPNRNRKTKTMKVSTLICLSLHGPRRNGQYVCHGAAGIECDRPENLSWGSHWKNNVDDKVRDGTITRGERNHFHKLTADDVRHIRSLRSIVPQRELSSKFGVSENHISRIQRRKTWTWLQEDAG